MTETISTITSPIALCAYVVFTVFAFLANKWKPESDRPRDRQLFYLASSIAVIALIGGLLLAWALQSSSASPPPSTVVQSSSGDQSPNINSSGSSSASVQIGNAPAPMQKKPEGKTK